MKRAFITGITGQDGSYLTDLLLEKGYEVHGLVHRPETLPGSNLRHLLSIPGLVGERLFLHHGAFEDLAHLRRLIFRAKPDEFYHLAGQSNPRLSLQMPEGTLDSVGLSTLRLLEVMRDLPVPPRFLHASSSEVYGSAEISPQDERTTHHPTTPYGAAKSLSQQLVRIYRVAYGLPACSAILFNHESPRRGRNFVTMKVAQAAARIKAGLEQELCLGNLQGRRDWGWAPDYVQGLWLMLQQPEVDDFVLATGEVHSVQELVQLAFDVVELEWQRYVRTDPTLLAKVEPIAPCGNPAKAQQILGWQNTVPFPEMVKRLVDAEMRNIF